MSLVIDLNLTVEFGVDEESSPTVMHLTFTNLTTGCRNNFEVGYRFDALSLIFLIEEELKTLTKSYEKFNSQEQISTDLILRQISNCLENCEYLRQIAIRLSKPNLARIASHYQSTFFLDLKEYMFEMGINHQPSSINANKDVGKYGDDVFLFYNRLLQKR